MRDTAEAAPARVAFFSASLDRGGAEKQLVYMVRALRAAGVEVRVCTIAGGGAHGKALRDDGMLLTEIGLNRTRLGRVTALYRSLHRFRPDVIQAVHFHLTPYVVAVARLLGALAVAGLRNDGHHALSGLGRVGPWILRLPDGIVANSHLAESNLTRLAARGPVAVVRNVIDLAEFDSATVAPAPTRASPTVMGVGRLVAVKGFDRFLKVLQLVRVRRPGVRGVIVGDGPERPRLEHLAGELGLLPDGVHFAGQRDDVPGLLTSADVLLLTSKREGFPNVVLEAMAAEVPVVTTDVGDVATVIEHGVTGYVVSAGVEPLAERVTALVDSPELRARLGAAGRQRVEESYDVSGLAERLLRAYRDIARVRRPGIVERLEAARRRERGSPGASRPAPTLGRVDTGW